MLSHNVFFSLHDNSPAAVDRPVAACKTYLTNHPGSLLCGRHARPRVPAAGQRSGV